MLAFTHMIPHSLSVMASANIDSSYAFKFTVLGYMLVFTVEKILFDSHEILHQAVEPPPDQGATTHSPDSHAHTPGTDMHSRENTAMTDENGRDSVQSGGPPLSAKSALVLLLAMAVHR